MLIFNKKYQFQNIYLDLLIFFRNLNNLTKDIRERLFSKKLLNYIHEIPEKSIIKQRFSNKKIKNDFIKSLHKKIIKVTNNKNLMLSNHSNFIIYLIPFKVSNNLITKLIFVIQEMGCQRILKTLKFFNPMSF